MEKITFEQFFEAVDEECKPFVQDLHNFLLENGCKVTFEEKKSGFLASYKQGKPPRAFVNFIFRKQGLLKKMLTRIYGERISGYPDFLDALPAEMVKAIENSGDCKRLISNGCSPKCVGYDFTIGDAHFQKCRYNCFEFLITAENNPTIKAFIEHELKERQGGAHLS
ncbi:MAG: hypothetical protein FWF80_04210 [Defluviitaleaceae bacterium]|nr:hypothetical protein [Defluviitaleaceae bacterium]